MMSKSSSAAIRGLKALYVLPIVCLALASNVRTVYAQSKDTAALTVAGIQGGNRLFMEEEVVCVRYAGSPSETVVGKHDAVAMPRKVATKDKVTEPAVFGAEDGNFSRWLAQMLPYPAESLHQGRVVDVISSSPAWTPAKKNGKSVATLHVQPINFISRYSARKPKS